MPDAAAARPARTLARRMRRVLVECRKVERGDSPGAVHDLRVALRRCRSIAQAAREIDPDPRWSTMRRASRRLARRLGELRDVEVARGWVEQLAPSRADPVRRAFRAMARGREAVLEREARTVVHGFDRRRWAGLRRALVARLDALALDELTREHMALERYEDARALYQRAQRARSAVAYHRLRIALKQFRYFLETFLPTRAAAWGADLKALQDRLGEAHDLDLLGSALVALGHVGTPRSALGWRRRLGAERGARLDEYRRLARGRRSVWLTWRAGLPSGERLERAALAKLAAWARCRDPHVARTEQVASRALDLFDRFAAASVAEPFERADARRILEAAALTHDVGRMLGRRGHHKASRRMIAELAPPLGWTREEMNLVALIARYHRGALPAPAHRRFAALGPCERDTVQHLAGLLRLALALEREGHRVSPPAVTAGADGIVIEVAGLDAGAPIARVVRGAALLERACRRRVNVRSSFTHPGAPQPG